MRQLLIASNNVGKLHEFEALLNHLPLALILPRQIGLQLDVEENGDSYAANATLKAIAFAKASGLLTLADDSGLEMDALGGAPGIYSARYSTKPGATDADRRLYLLEQLQGKPRPWRARFCCTVALTPPEGPVQLCEGFCPGEIIPSERGSNGFGYDPIFLLPELGCTMAELATEVKNTLSHRARATQAAWPMIESYLC
jgi:XTP/dITP diphosphohydrolase